MLQDWGEFTKWSEDDYMSVLQRLPQELAEADNKAADLAAPGRPRLWTLQDVWTALQRSCGNIAAAAHLLSETHGATCTPDTISRLTRNIRSCARPSRNARMSCLNSAATRWRQAQLPATTVLADIFSPISIRNIKARTETDIKPNGASSNQLHDLNPRPTKHC